MRGVERKIKALKDFTLKTYYETHILIKDEVRIVRFKDNQTFDALLKFKHFIVAKPKEKEVRNTPVLLPEIDEDVSAVSEEEIKYSGIEGNLPPIELVIDDNSDGEQFLN